MSIRKIILKIKKEEGCMGRIGYKCIHGVLRFSIPVNSITKPIFLFFYYIHVYLRDFFELIIKILYYEPLFRARCEKVGRNLRMEKLPYITGQGRIIVGDNVYLSGKSDFFVGGKNYSQPELIIGNNTFIGHDCSIRVNQKVSIGNNCLLAKGVMVFDNDGHPGDYQKRRDNLPVDKKDIRPVIIEDDVWVGTRAIVLKGVRIGARSIIGAGSIVTQDVPSDSLVAGNPARTIKTSKQDVQ